MEHARKLPLSLHNTLTARKEQQQRQAQACKQALRHACALACPGKPACHACRARERACTCTKHACGRTAFRYTGGYAGIHAGLCSRCMPTKQCACCMLHVAWRLAVHVCQDHSEPRSAVTFILRRCAACCPAPCTIQSPASAAEPSTRPARGAPLHKQLRAQPGPDRVCAHAKCTYHAQVRSIRHTAWQRPWPHRGRTRRLTRWTTPLTCDVPQAVQKGCSRRARTRERMSNMKQHEHEAMRLFACHSDMTGLLYFAWSCLWKSGVPPLVCSLGVGSCSPRMQICMHFLADLVTIHQTFLALHIQTQARCT